ncbi:hypothetical protein BIW19_00220 [Pseudomonas putida]|nr:hypothetical protein BIW19_00220 [Pseudomonas putida]
MSLEFFCQGHGAAMQPIATQGRSYTRPRDLKIGARQKARPAMYKRARAFLLYHGTIPFA